MRMCLSLLNVYQPSGIAMIQRSACHMVNVEFWRVLVETATSLSSLLKFFGSKAHTFSFFAECAD